MEKSHNHGVVGNFHLYECFGSVWMLFDSVYERVGYQDSGEVNDATDGEVRTDSKLRPVG